MLKFKSLASKSITASEMVIIHPAVWNRLVKFRKILFTTEKARTMPWTGLLGEAGGLITDFEPLRSTP